MDIDIDSLSEEELRELNRRIVARLKLIRAMHTHHAMIRFNPGEQVTFETTAGERVFATLVKYNQKTVTVITESGDKWNVSPGLLSPLKTAQSRRDYPANVFRLSDQK